jgi:subfamily B ATP-binding cassette protein MsbA
MTMVALMGVVLYRDWKMALVAILVIPLSGGLIQRLGRSLRAVAKESQERMADMTAMLHETCSGIRVVQAFGMEDYEIGRFNKGNQDYYETVRRTIVINELSSPLLEFLGAFGIAGIIYYGGSMVMRGETTVGAFFSFLAALFMLYAPISKLSRVNNKIQHAMAAARRVFDLMDTPPSITEKPDCVDIPALKRGVEFRNVSFSYDQDRNALTGINLSVKKGELIALVGPSGAGKTTLVNIIPRFLDVTQGAVLIDGVDTRDVTIKSLRGQTGIVTQDVFLFHDTVRNNIAYGRNDADMEHVESAAKAAYAHDFIMEMPQGYDAVIGERGAKLSGGQRQRISIARAIMKDPAIMILDEATSALDSESEKMVQKALANLLAGRTTFVIAHRLSTVINADRIIVMDRGAIAQAGSHDELMAAGGLYRRLFESQFAGEAPAADVTPTSPVEVE